MPAGTALRTKSASADQRSCPGTGVNRWSYGALACPVCRNGISSGDLRQQRAGIRRQTVAPPANNLVRPKQSEPRLVQFVQPFFRQIKDDEWNAERPRGGKKLRAVRRVMPEFEAA